MTVDRHTAAAAEQELATFYKDLEAARLQPLWTITGDLLPPRPQPDAVPWLWPAETMRPLAEQAIRLVPVERGGDSTIFWFAGPALPMIQALDAIFFEPYPDLQQPVKGAHNTSERAYQGAAGRFTPDQVTDRLEPVSSPPLIYRWGDTHAQPTRIVRETRAG